jgi:hypothetical protein
LCTSWLWVVIISVAWTPNLMNSALLHRVFQNFVVPWKIHIYKNLILSSDSSRRDASNGIRVAYVNFYHKWVPTTRLKIILKLQQIPKYEKIDYPPVNHPSNWAWNTSWSWRWQRSRTPRTYAE